MNKQLQPLTPAALYARVSSDRQDVDLSVAAQLRALRDYAEKNRYAVAREYVDEAESGRIADRPEFQRMLDEARRTNAPFQEILVWKFSRFTRKREHAVAFKSMLRRRGIRVVSITEHADDSPTGKLMEAIIESLDEFYSENLVWGITAKDRVPPVRVENAFPAIVSKEDYNRVARIMQANAPAKQHPQRTASPYLLSGLAKCAKCNKALIGQEAKSGQYAYYVCQSLLKRGQGTCHTPRLNAKRFEHTIIDQIRKNILTESNIRTLVELVNEELDEVLQEKRERLEIVNEELVEVRRRMDRLWHAVETTDLEINDIIPRLREHQERQEKLEAAEQEARESLSKRPSRLNDIAIASYAQEMGEFLMESELTESKAFIRSFVKEIVVSPGRAIVRYTIPISQSTRKAQVLMGGRFGCDQVEVRRTDSWGPPRP